MELYILSFLAGIIGANGVPHFVKGITGQKHMTPLGRPSSPVVNVVWGWLNFAVAIGLLYWAPIYQHELRALVLVAVGALITSVFLAWLWSRHPEYNGKK